MTVETELARRAGLLAARLGKPLITCPYDPDGPQAAQALAFVRGWTAAAGTEAAQVADSFERGGHTINVTRGEGGRFGRGSRLGDVMHAVAQVDDDDEADSISFGDNEEKSFDWSSRNTDGSYTLDIMDNRPRPEPDPDSEDDDDDDEDEEDDDYRGFARLRMSPNDMKRFAAGLSASLLVHQMRSTPMGDDDPNRPLIAALVANTPMGVTFENEWSNQSINWGLPYNDGSVRLSAVDDDGDEASFTLDVGEVRRLHAQLVRQNMEEDDNPFLRRRQTAAVEIIERDGHHIPVMRGAKGRFSKISAVAQALQESGNAADSLSSFDRPALMREAKRRNLDIPRGASPDAVREAILGDARAGSEMPPRPTPGDGPQVNAQFLAKQRATLTGLNMTELKLRAKSRNIAFGSKIKKADLVDLIMQDAENPMGINKDLPSAPRAPLPRIKEEQMDALLYEVQRMVDNPRSADRDRMNGIFGRMSVPQLERVAADQGTRLDPTARTKALKASRLTEHLIGHKLDSQSIENAIMGDGVASRAKEEAARARQGTIDAAIPRAQFLADLEEALDNDTDIPALRRMTNQALRVRGVAGDPHAEGLAGVVATSIDTGEIRRALNASTAAQGMRRIDAGDGRFDPAQHTAIGKLKKGERVELVRPGHATTINGEEVTLSRPVVASEAQRGEERFVAERAAAAQKLLADRVPGAAKPDADRIADYDRRIDELQVKIRRAGSESEKTRLTEKRQQLRQERADLSGVPARPEPASNVRLGSNSREARDEREALRRETDTAAGRDRSVRRRAAARQAGADSPLRGLSGSDLTAALDTTRDEAVVRGALEGRDLAELVQIARDLPDVQMPDRQNRTALVDAITRGTAGRPKPAPDLPTADDFSRAVGGGLTQMMEQQAIGDQISRAIDRYRDEGDTNALARAEKVAAQHKRGMLLPEDADELLAQIDASRTSNVDPVPATRPRPVTSRANAHTLTRGDQFISGNGEVLTVVGHQQGKQDGVPVQHLDVIGPDGQERRLTMGLNQPLDRLVGVRGGGGGTFALEDPLAPALQPAEGLDEFAMPPQLAEYWVHGEGAARVRWFVRGAFRRARRLLRGEGVPEHELDGAVANLYRLATGKNPGRHRRGDRALAMGAQVAGAAAMECAREYEQGTIPFGVSPHMGWSGPLAPIDIATGDKRRFEPGALTSRQLPLPFMWQKHRGKGHDGAVTVGALTSYDLAPDGSIINAAGYFLDPARIPEVSEAMHLVEHGVVGPSVDLGPGMKVAFRSPTTGEFNPNACTLDGTCPDDGEAVITHGEIVGATLVPIAAFAEARAPKMFRRTIDDDTAVMAALSSQTAAVASHWDDIAIAPIDTPWAGDAPARQQLLAWSVAEPLPVGEAETDFNLFRLGFLHVGEHLDDETAYSLPIAAVIDGELQIVPQAVFAAAMRLDTLPVSSTEKTALRSQLDDLYDQMAEALGDDTLQPPWQLSAAPDEGCGCAEKWAKAAQTADAGSYGVFGDMAPYDHKLFSAQLAGPTPMTVTEDGRVFGHAFLWSTCNRGHRGMCLRAPKSATGYKEFHLGAVRTDKGLLPVGKIVMGEGHADIEHGTRITRAFYDATSKTVALGRITEDQFGGAFAGVLAPGVTPEEATMLLASPPSGDWRNRELIAVLAVNVPGHVVARAEVTGGEPVNMVAAGRWHGDDMTADVEDAVIEAAAMAFAEAAFAVADTRELMEAAEQLWAAQAATIASVLSEGGSR